ncbi:MAG: TonB-dependent receptor [Gammaproteobacteria bacterium]|nr:TonB-dependent receptor [Gammaproteobacteria bacterium]
MSTDTLISSVLETAGPLSIIGPLTLIASLALAADADVAQDDLIELSLEELLNVEVTSVSRRSQSLSTAAAAVFVISEQDIRRSGATTIPGALRMVPGVNVAQIDGNKWAVTARGFNGRFAAKLLVLVDGRTVYTPLFSGVFWDIQDISLESIERIEVIRGPGATLWGANAVNGIINIITKSASVTGGGFVNAGVGSNGGNEAAFRYGGAISDDTHYRVYAKHHDRVGNRDLAGNPTADDWQSARVGLRIDKQSSNGDSLMFISEIYDSEMGATLFQPLLQPPYASVADSAEKADGYFAQVAWTRNLGGDSEINLQVYYDHRERHDFIFKRFTGDTIDLDFQHTFGARERHNLVWGLGYRINQDEATNSPTQGLIPSERTQRWASAFVQDEITLRPENMYLTLGFKIEDNSFSQEDIEFEPNIRLRWQVGDAGTAWASVSRAIRLPSRGDLDSTYLNAVIPPLTPPNNAPVPLAITFNGNPAALSEELVAYELGYRVQSTDDVAFDLAAFFHQHDNERSVTAGAPVCMPSGVPTFVDPLCVLSSTHIESPLLLQSNGEYETYGLEAVVDWTPTNWWRLQAAVSSIRVREASTANPSPLTGSFVQESPDFQASIRSMMNFSSELEFDTWLHFTDELPSAGINSYVSLDMRIGWSPLPELEFSLVGQNLLDNAHQEFISELMDVVPTAIERRAYVEASWSF